MFYKNVSKSGNKILVLLYEKNKTVCKIIDIKTEKESVSFETKDDITEGGFSPNEKYFYLVSQKTNKISLYLNNDGAEKYTEFSGSLPIDFTKDDRYCTYTDKDFYSYRRDQSTEGRIYIYTNGNLVNDVIKSHKLSLLNFLK